MTPAEEARFIARYQAGATYRELAAAFGCALSTVADWVTALVAAGKIAKRPHGGSHGRPCAQARPGEPPAPVQRPVQNFDTGALQTFDTGPVQRLDRLEDEVQGLRQLAQAVLDRLDHPLVQTPVQITALPPYPKGKAVRWNLWILDAIRDELAALATERGVSPSQLVQELLWKELRRE
jgi:DNA-binding transcriptional MocR family regulator